MDGGPPVFPQDSSCPAVLWIPAAPFRLRIQGSHPLWPAFPCRSPGFQLRDVGPNPGKPCGLPVWPPPLSLATTRGISVDVFSSPYLDVSVQAVPFRNLWIQLRMTEYGSAGFPHSEISGSMRMCRSPKLIAACHVLRRLLMPRHSPCALIRLTSRRCKLHIPLSGACAGARSFRCISSPKHNVRFVLLGDEGTGLTPYSLFRDLGSLNYAGSFRILLRNCVTLNSSTIASEFPSVALLVFPLFSFQCAEQKIGRKYAIGIFPACTF